MPSTPNPPNGSTPPIEPGAADPGLEALDLERAEANSQGAPVCAQCATPITDRYFTLGSHVLCETCHLAFRDAKPPGNAAARFFGATALGALAAAVGCALWMLVTELTGYEIGLIAIVVGYLVGMAVNLGARRVGGIGYQLLAVFLTYTAIVMTYVPAIANELMASEEFRHGIDAAGAEGALDEFGATRDDDRLEGEGAEARAGDAVDTEDANAAAMDAATTDAAAMDPSEREELAWIAALPIAYMLPFLLGFENIIGLLIIGFALWQAFRMNARVKLELQGPFRLEARDPALG